MFTLKLEDIPEEGLSVNWEEKRDSLLAYLRRLSSIDFDFETSLLGEARITRAGKSYLIQGGLQTLLRLHCVRCLKEFSYPLSSTFDLTLHPLKETPLAEEVELDVEDMESNFFEGGRSISPKSPANRFSWRFPINRSVQRIVKASALSAVRIETSPPVVATGKNGKRDFRFSGN